jgi:hypothetical protein
MLKIVNMIPNGWSDEENQDCEPNLSVNPANHSEIIGTAFTFDNPAGTSAISPAMTGNWAPFFSSVRAISFRPGTSRLGTAARAEKSIRVLFRLADSQFSSAGRRTLPLSRQTSPH